MQLTLNGKNIDITDAIRSYVNEKLEKVEKHNGQIMNMKITLSVTKNPSVKKNCTAEATCFLNGAVIKVKEDAESMYAAIDLLSDRLDRQVRETKEKVIKKSKSAKETIRAGSEEEMEELSPEEAAEEEIPEVPAEVLEAE